jgi:predicted RNA-binding Zn ribbon-like protein
VPGVLQRVPGALEQEPVLRVEERGLAGAVSEEARVEAVDLLEVGAFVGLERAGVVAAGARERVELVAADDGVSLGHSHVGDPVDDILARIAERIVREIGSGHDDRVRICANDTCRWIFFDESRSGRRRWCDMATCGNRAKARRHRERQKSGDQEGASA